MAGDLKEFGGIATGLARSPLGIIALFIVLVYGLAALVLMIGNGLGAGERAPLIWFLVLFPVLVLAVFTFLVGWKQEKLIWPSDFKDERNYLDYTGRLGEEVDVRAASIVEQAVAEPGKISPEQIRASAQIELHARSVDDGALREQLDRVCLEYERIRGAMPSGPERTRAMTGVLVRMRTLGPACAHLLPELKAAETPGKRLAAVAIMQIRPETADIAWLVERFRVDSPFIFSNAALVLQYLALSKKGARAESAVAAAREALGILRSAKAPPDRNTMRILQPLAALAGRAGAG
jgi:hypothetical protein